MLPQHRPSILWRPRGQPSQCNVESAETEYQRYQARLVALQDRAAAQESRLLNNIYPPGKQIQTHSDLFRPGEANQGLADSKEQAGNQSSHHREHTMEHPWCLEPQDNEATVRDAIRRRESQATMRQNMETAEKKKRILEQERARERRIDSSTLTSENQWWNYGAASEKWIPPEHRVRGRGSKTVYAETLHSGSGDILQWHEETPRSSSQASVASCNYTAPYATSENAPAPRRTAYRPQAPYHTQLDSAPSATSQSLRPLSDTSRTSSTRPPFSLHDDPSASTVGPARPHRRDARPQTARSTAAPFDRDDQPAPPPRRAVFRTGYGTHSQCPFDREDAAVAPRPRQRTTTYPYATSEQPPLRDNRAAHRTRGDGSMRKYGASTYGVENEGAVSNRSPAHVHAAGKPSPPKHPKESLDAGGGRLSPASAKFANAATTEEVPMTYPFVATAAGTQPAQPGRTAPHTPEAPRRMSRGTPESISRRQAMHRSEGVDAALHAYAESVAVSSPGDSITGCAAGADERSGTRPLVETVVAKHASRGEQSGGNGREHHRFQSQVSSNGDDRHASSVRGGPYSQAGQVRPPYAVLGDKGSRRDVIYGQTSMSGYTGSDRSGTGMSLGHQMVQPEWMHIERPAGKPTGREVMSSIRPQSPGGGSGRGSVHNHDQVAQVMQHSEASLRTAPGGDMFGMIDQLSRKYGAATLK